MSTILWLSRHLPTDRQRAELERLYPGHTLTIDRNSFSSANDIIARYKASGAVDIVVVGPLSFVREIVRQGLYPLWAEMRQVARGSPQAETTVNGRSYRFIKFNRIKSVKVELEAVHPAVASAIASPTPTAASTIAPTEAAVANPKEETSHV